MVTMYAPSSLIGMVTMHAPSSLIGMVTMHAPSSLIRVDHARCIVLNFGKRVLALTLRHLPQSKTGCVF